MRSGLFIAGCLLLFSSCVTNKKVTLLQKGDLHKKDLPKDSTVRAYPIKSFEYRIQPQDALMIRFETIDGEEDFNFLNTGQVNTGNMNPNNPGAVVLNSDLVDEEGNIVFPVVGKVRVEGLTVFEAQDTLQAIASRYVLTGVKVRVRLVNFRFSVLGEVVHEGQVTSFNNRVTLTEAIALAGGVGELADRANIKVIRMQNGASEIGYVNLLDENVINSPYYYINQNDVLIVPPLKQRPFRRYFGQNLSLFISSLSLLLLVINLSR